MKPIDTVVTNDERPTVLITGGSRGIGHALAKLLPDYDLLIGGRDTAQVTAVCNDLPSARPFVADLTDDDALRAACAGITRLDGLVHSAGALGVHKPLDELSREAWKSTFDINVFSVAELTRLLLDPLAAAGGTVVMVNSGSGLNAHGPGGIYSASKFALRAFTDALRDEVADRGIRVTSLHPGRTATDMQRALRDAEGEEYEAENYLDPTSVAKAAAFALRAPRDASVSALTISPNP